MGGTKVDSLAGSPVKKKKKKSEVIDLLRAAPTTKIIVEVKN
jgi:hypothetical protein